MKILGIETSCDETSASVVENGRNVLSNVVVTQMDIHAEFGGVIPEIASRHHVTSITKVIEKALIDANLTGNDIDLVAVTKAPGLVGSLLVGINAAKAFSYSFNKPIVGMHHIKGHIYANILEKDFVFPLIALVVSGGHTELIYMEGHNRFKVIGSTLDDAVGEAYDKVSRVLGLGYPGGPIIDKLAKNGVNNIPFPKAMINSNDYNFSFSGIKSSVINYIHNNSQKNEQVSNENVAASFQECVVDILVEKTMKAATNYKAKQVIIAGGVAANSRLRERITEEVQKLDNLDLIIPTFKNCTDNAAMIAAAAYYQFKDNGRKDDLYLNGVPNYELSEN